MTVSEERKSSLQKLKRLVETGYISGDSRELSFEMDMREAHLRWGTHANREYLEELNTVLHGLIRMNWAVREIEVGTSFRVVFTRNRKRFPTQWHIGYAAVRRLLSVLKRIGR